MDVLSHGKTGPGSQPWQGTSSYPQLALINIITRTIFNRQMLISDIFSQKLEILSYMPSSNSGKTGLCHVHRPV
ncbi:hypothetical protein TNCV_4825481 [Trichonephila clavipes]|uniref:Uncharacterized protein n=1 Tax=Trichonephila clavipes TaxID=2585209 RepID=A0A8X6V1B0_TRICX|nr:hypothetical protein TNCV_4825481 [Trichonephila clavipes]